MRSLHFAHFLHLDLYPRFFSLINWKFQLHIWNVVKVTTDTQVLEGGGDDWASELRKRLNTEATPASTEPIQTLQEFIGLSGAYLDISKRQVGKQHDMTSPSSESEMREYVAQLRRAIADFTHFGGNDIPKDKKLKLLRVNLKDVELEMVCWRVLVGVQLPHICACNKS